MQQCSLAERMDKAGIVIPDAASLAGLGSVAIAEDVSVGNQANTSRSLGLSAFNECVLLVASVGATTEEAAEVFSCEQAKVERARDETNDFFDVPTMAASVNKAVLKGMIPIKAASDHRRINNQQLLILQSVAAGKSNGAVAHILGLHKPRAAKLMDGLWFKLGATGRTHGIRRSYEVELAHRPGWGEEAEVSLAMMKFLRDQASARQNFLANQ